MTKTFIFLILILSLNRVKASGSDTLKITAMVDCCLDSQFYKCRSNSFKEVLDTLKARDRVIHEQISIEITDKLVTIKTSKGVINYKLLHKSGNEIKFESLKRQFGEAISICNRDRYPYCLTLDLEKLELELVFDQTFIQMYSWRVFKGKILNYQNCRSINNVSRAF